MRLGLRYAFQAPATFLSALTVVFRLNERSRQNLKSNCSQRDLSLSGKLDRMGVLWQKKLMEDYIIASKIEVFCRIGCTEAERAFPQRLLVSLRFTTSTRAAAMSGHLSQTVDYAAACERVREIAAAKEWVLIEELSEAYAEHLLKDFPNASAVNICIEKFVLPGVDWVGVEIKRERINSGN